MLLMTQGRCWVVSMIYPPMGYPAMLIEGQRALATRRIFRSLDEATHYASGIANCFQAKTHLVQGVQVFDTD